MPNRSFPADFLWGASTAGHQVEGGNINADIWPIEWSPGSFFVEPSGDACDHYHRYPEDIALLRDLGFNAYRFSLEWSRIEPEPGYFSRAALDHYRRMVATCHELGVTPVVTYNHFTLPRWMAGDGGWHAPTAPARFARYAAEVTRRLGDLLSWVCTLNEPNCVALLEATGVIPMGVSEQGLQEVPGPAVEGGIGGFDPATYRYGLRAAGIDKMAAAHRLGAEEIKSGPGTQMVGWTLALIDMQAAEGGQQRWEDARRRGETAWLEISSEDDFVGVQTYSRVTIGPQGTVAVGDEVPKMQTGWEMYPPALGHTVRLAAEVAGVPILVTENGVATDDDRARIDYTRGALEGLHDCIDDGLDVRGYLHWSLLDNFEWTSGFAKTFGIVAFESGTFARTVKASGHWLGAVARANALSDGLAAGGEA